MLLEVVNMLVVHFICIIQAQFVKGYRNMAMNGTTISQQTMGWKPSHQHLRGIYDANDNILSGPLQGEYNIFLFYDIFSYFDTLYLQGMSYKGIWEGELSTFLQD